MLFRFTKLYPLPASRHPLHTSPDLATLLHLHPATSVFSPAELSAVRNEDSSVLMAVIASVSCSFAARVRPAPSCSTPLAKRRWSSVSTRCSCWPPARTGAAAFRTEGQGIKDGSKHEAGSRRHLDCGGCRHEECRRKAKSKNEHMSPAHVGHRTGQHCRASQRPCTHRPHPLPGSQ